MSELLCQPSKFGAAATAWNGRRLVDRSSVHLVLTEKRNLLEKYHMTTPIFLATMDGEDVAGMAWVRTMCGSLSTAINTVSLLEFCILELIFT